MKSFMGIISEKNISLFKMKESKREKIMESCTPGRYFTTKKTAGFLTEIFLSDKIVQKNRDFTRFPGKFPVFCVLTLPPGLTR